VYGGLAGKAHSAWDQRKAMRLAVAVLLVAIMSVVSMIVTLNAAWAARENTQDAREESMSSLADVMEQRVLGYVGEAESVTSQLSGALAEGTTSHGELPDELLRQLVVHEYVRAITVTYPDGTFVIARHDGDGFMSRVVDPSTDPSVTYTLYDANLVALTTDHDPFDYVATDAPTYTLAAASDALEWTEPALRPVTLKPGVWATQASRDEAGTLVAVVSTDIYVEKLSPALVAAAYAPDGEGFLLGSDRTVIAAPPRYDDEISRYADEHGLVTPAAVLGVYTTAAASPGEPEDLWGTAGSLITLERGIVETDLPWVLHLQVPADDIGQGSQSVERAMLWAIIATVIAVATSLWALFSVRGALLEVRRRTYVDQYSGLYTTRGFERFAPRAVRHVRADGKALCAAVVHVHGLDVLAKTRGVFSLDAALQTVGEIVLLEIRASDIAVRRGGRDVVLLVGLTNTSDASMLVERVRAHLVEALSMKFGADSPLEVTIGYAVSSQTEEVDPLIERAEKVLEEGIVEAAGHVYAERVDSEAPRDTER